MEKNEFIRTSTTEMVIGKCKYIVVTHFKENGRETAKQKLLRYVSDRVAEELKSSETP